MTKKQPKKPSRRHYHRAWFDALRAFVDEGIERLPRSEGFVYLILLRDTKPDGIAQTGLTDLARRGGMSKSAASRAIRSLIKRRVLRVVRRGFQGAPTRYTVFTPTMFRSLNSISVHWPDDDDDDEGN